MAVGQGADVVVNVLVVSDELTDAILVGRLVELLKRGQHLATGEIVYVDEIEHQSISDALMGGYL